MSHPGASRRGAITGSLEITVVYVRVRGVRPRGRTLANQTANQHGVLLDADGVDHQIASSEIRGAAKTGFSRSAADRVRVIAS